MKKKLLLIILAVAFPMTVMAGEVKTKDEPEKCGGYHDGTYNLKCKGEKKNFVDRDQGWKNPFKGFTKTSGTSKTKKQGSMPHSR